MDDLRTQDVFQLLARCRERDTAAFEEIIRRYHHPLTYYVRRLVDDAAIAEDVMQEVWIGVWAGVQSLRDPALFTVWLYRIARNRSAQYWRRRWKEVEVEEGLDVDEVAPSAFEQREDIERVHALLEKLPFRQREALVLYFLEDMSYEDIAQVTDSAIGTVRSRIHYGKRALRTIMEEERHDE